MRSSYFLRHKMIHDHRPYYLKHLFVNFEIFYTKHFIAPQLESLGKNAFFMRPWNINLFGANISFGNNAHIVTASDRKVSLSTWNFEENAGRITIKDNCLLCPGVRIDSASSIEIEDNCMLAAGSYITDADWHDIYDRTRAVGSTKPIRLEQNVWIGDGAIICKGVTVGENSIVGAGSVVVNDVPANCIAAGNPARLVKTLDEKENLVTREQLFKDPQALAQSMDNLDHYVLGKNTLLKWLRVKLFPRPGD